jgi:hypothetical protein
MKMEGISKQELIRVKENMPDGTSKLFVHTLITMCKELPDQQWQTLDEFNANPVDGWCFLIHSRFNHRTMGNHNLGRFWIDGGICKEENITHVMPIKTPESPK